ncbi:AAA family ATPase [Rothia terrae]|uniref:AAA family ATPase n=1 Tax=Rothia terrae TaxID=396015 RepID=UPI001445FA0E|nr:AAA family ATPase [Rothia terrae]NKZ34533.1 AAA family ATPase [Rothia terrae]
MENNIADIVSIDKRFSDITDLISTTVDDFHVRASENVALHIQKHGVSPSWIQQGLRSSENEDCPFCDQNLTDSTIYQQYQVYFNEEINEFLQKLDSLDISFKPDQISLLSGKIKDWNRNQIANRSHWVEDGFEELAVPEVDRLVLLTESFYIIARDLIVAKKEKFHESMVDSSNYKELFDKYNAINDNISSLEERINNINKTYETYKQSLDSSDINSVQRELYQYQVKHLRSTSEVSKIIDKIEIGLRREAGINKIKKDLRKEYTDEVDLVLSTYKDSINRELGNLYANFDLSAFKTNFRGGERTEFYIKLRGNEITTSGNDNRFGTALSEGDKRTLSFAFFISALKRSRSLSNSIVFFDDPFTSLDSVRRRKTIEEIIKISKDALQVFILTHDEFFAKDIFQKCTASDESVHSVEISSTSDRYSSFIEIDLFQKCQSDYYKRYDNICQFIENPSVFADKKIIVAQSIRPLLEGYLHRKFPRSLSRSSMLGTVITTMSNDNTNLFPYDSLQIDILRDINGYASQFHHDTNPECNNVEIYDDELRNYCEKTLGMLHS